MWALGATFFMLLTGGPPFVGSGLLEVYERIVQLPLVRPATPQPRALAAALVGATHCASLKALLCQSECLRSRLLPL